MSGYFVKIVITLLVTALLSAFLKNYRPELAVLVAAAGGIVSVLMLINGFSPVIKTVKSAFSGANLDISCFETVLKALGISYISAFAADTCRDAGQSALALKAELAGKCAVFALCIPMIVSLLKIALEVAGI